MHDQPTRPPRDKRAELLDLTDITPALVAQLDDAEVQDCLTDAYRALMVQS